MPQDSTLLSVVDKILSNSIDPYADVHLPTYGNRYLSTLLGCRPNVSVHIRKDKTIVLWDEHKESSRNSILLPLCAGFHYGWFVYNFLPYNMDFVPLHMPIVLGTIVYNDTPPESIDLSVATPLAMLYSILSSPPLMYNTVKVKFSEEGDCLMRFLEIEVFRDETIKATTEVYKIEVETDGINGPDKLTKLILARRQDLELSSSERGIGL